MSVISFPEIQAALHFDKKFQPHQSFNQAAINSHWLAIPFTFSACSDEGQQATEQVQESENHPKWNSSPHD